MTPELDEHYRKLERMYHGAAINAYFRPVATISKGRCEIVIPVRPDFHHAAGSVHGSVFFKALDDAAYFAVQSLVREYFLVTANFSLFLERPVQAGEIRAVGEVVTAGRNLFLGQAVLTDAEGRELARGSGNFMKSSARLTAEIGYL